MLGGEAFGLRSEVDLLIAERNLGEMARWQPQGSTRRSYVFAECGTPSETLVFDALIHRDVFPGSIPELAVYDTILEGVVDPNDPARQVDRLETSDQVTSLGRGLQNAAFRAMPTYRPMLEAVLQGMGWLPQDFQVLAHAQRLSPARGAVRLQLRRAAALGRQPRALLAQEHALLAQEHALLAQEQVVEPPA